MNSENNEEKNGKIKPDSIAQGYAVGMSVLAVSAQIVAFPLLGFYVDNKLNTGVVFGAAGFAIGMYTAITQLLRLSKRNGNEPKS